MLGGGVVAGKARRWERARAEGDRFAAARRNNDTSAATSSRAAASSDDEEEVVGQEKGQRTVSERASGSFWYA